MSCQPPNEIQLLFKILITSLLTKSLPYFQNFPFKYGGKYGKHKSFASLQFTCCSKFEISQTSVDFVGFCFDSLLDKKNVQGLTLLILKMF